MDPRVSSPPSFHDFKDHHDRHHPERVHMMPNLPFSSHGPLPIPSRAAMHTAPPPLPPPPRIRDLENGYDAGWLHANSSRSTTALPPVNPNSSLFGGHRRPESAFLSDRMALDELEGRQSGLPLSRSPEAHIKIEPPPPTDEGFPNSMSVNSAGPILKGERDFSLRSVKDSSNAYDQHLLSKIGNSLSPRTSISQGSDHRGSISALTVPSIPSRASSNLPSPGPSEAGSTLDVKWYNSAQSGGVSPRTKVGWRDYVEGRSPSVESNAPSSALDYDYMRDMGRRRYRGTTPSREDSISLPSRSNRGSYDQAVFSDIEGLKAGHEAPGLIAPTRADRRRSTDPTPDDEQWRFIAAADEWSTLFKFKHPIREPQLCPESPDSFSRIIPQHSDIWIILISSLDRREQHDESLTVRPTISGGFSPGSDLDTYHEKSIMNPSSPAALMHSLPRAVSGSHTLELSTTDAMGKMSMPSVLTVPKSAVPKISGLYICDCCPKKPKKFDNPDDLRAHEMEKQYSCQYCNNRFKNKNEAERHQTSIHLRRHSWSCAALSCFQAAFHASASPSLQTSAGPSHDSCGYCGEEFPNFPRPDWDCRFEHLTTVHKFGECNNAKKFFRADHFRQHLKHSHAGTSGKWTNILENACMKEEQPPEPRDKSRQGSGSLTSNTIDEVLSEQ
ncbi:uncharacterized protein N7482_002170 [Penicillium canariense]|uniref:C2H2-type domain-containing protein n=1 Tax=Penicillium canariense TaxID=189055 RepID=A0A9W9IGI0_9EURO|nr:uncharacterized protein N7482_002170 [Penicillium canariense]KAJ5176293.1 hypothetical protein N7482_002170 [Penicillium canariense]